MTDNKLLFTGISYMLFAVFFNGLFGCYSKNSFQTITTVTQIIFLRGSISLLIIGGAGYIARRKK